MVSTLGRSGTVRLAPLMESGVEMGGVLGVGGRVHVVGLATVAKEASALLHFLFEAQRHHFCLVFVIARSSGSTQWPEISS